jgi:segregation and condensation protein A
MSGDGKPRPLETARANEPVAVRDLADPWSEDERAPGEILVVDIAGFEGPLDLLLALARTQKVDLAQISVLQLVDQYLGFITEARQLRLELAADYLVMAAWLAFLKSRLLLPREEKQEDETSAEELAARLHFRLQRLAAMRQAASQLFTRQRLGRDVFARGMPEGMRTIRERQYTADIYDLLKAYADQRKRTTVKRAHVVRRRAVWSIKDARQRLERLVGLSSGSWVQLDLFIEQFLPTPELSRTALASSFGATLEMAREGLIEIRQDMPFAPIEMRSRTGSAERAGVSE